MTTLQILIITIGAIIITAGILFVTSVVIIVKHQQKMLHNFENNDLSRILKK